MQFIRLKKTNSLLYDREKYSLLVTKLDDITKNGAKCRADYDVRRLYELHVINEEKRIFRSDGGKEIVVADEMFDILSKTHLSTEGSC